MMNTVVRFSNTLVLHYSILLLGRYHDDVFRSGTTIDYCQRQLQLEDCCRDDAFHFETIPEFQKNLLLLVNRYLDVEGHFDTIV